MSGGKAGNRITLINKFVAKAVFNENQALKEQLYFSSFILDSAPYQLQIRITAELNTFRDAFNR